MSDPTGSIPLLAAYQDAVYRRDVEAFMRLYDADVCIFDAWGVWLYQGAAAWRESVSAWFQSLGEERVRVTFDEVRWMPGVGQSCLSAIVRYAAVSPAGDELRALHNRLTWVLGGAGAAPRIIHEHTSAPIGHADMRAMLTWR